MVAHTILAFTILALAAFGCANPVEKRNEFDVSSIIASATSVAASYYSEGTAAAASAYSRGLNAASSGIEEGLSDASTWLQSHGVATPSVFATETTIGGVVESIVSSVGGPAITLAASGAGVTTSFAGSAFTVVPSPTGTTNAALNVHHAMPGAPILAALLTVVGGTLLGAWLTC